MTPCRFVLAILLLAGSASAQSSIPLVDLAGETQRQVVVDREDGQYLGHVTTVLLEDGRTMLAVYPKGHGRGAIVLKRSIDGGRTWSGRLPTPDNWATSLEVPTIFRVTEPATGHKRLLLFSGLYPARVATSDNDGTTWTPLREVGKWGGIVVMGSLVTRRDGSLLALFHDDGRFLHDAGKATGSMEVYGVTSTDGGVTWNEPSMIVASRRLHLCEPGVVRSPDGAQLAMLLRENRRTGPSYVMFSDDEGANWSAPRPLPLSLAGDRHTAKYSPDGRLFISFRDMAPGSPTRGDWLGWVGTYDDLVSGREGEYRVRLMDNKDDWDCAYPGVEVLPDGTFVATTYGHWEAGKAPYIVSVRFSLAELDAKAGRGR